MHFFFLFRKSLAIVGYNQNQKQGVELLHFYTFFFSDLEIARKAKAKC